MTTDADLCFASPEDQKALAVRSLGYWSSGDLSDLNEVFLDSYQNHQEPDVEGGPKTIDLAEWSSIVTGFHASFPKTDVEIFSQLCDQQFVATRWRFVETQTGDYLGLPPTGKTVSWTGIQIDRFKSGKIAESWVNWDMYSLLKQLGLIE